MPLFLSLLPLILSLSSFPHLPALWRDVYWAVGCRRARCLGPSYTSLCSKINIWGQFARRCHMVAGAWHYSPSQTWRGRDETCLTTVGSPSQVTIISLGNCTAHHVYNYHCCGEETTLQEIEELCPPLSQQPSPEHKPVQDERGTAAAFNNLYTSRWVIERHLSFTEGCTLGLHDKTFNSKKKCLVIL